MPILQMFSLDTEWRYTLAHEFGHAITPWNRMRSITREWSAVGFYFSHYGQSDPAEGFAEAFAEFYLSEGKTINPAARAYAVDFGWEHGMKGWG